MGILAVSVRKPVVKSVISECFCRRSAEFWGSGDYRSPTEALGDDGMFGDDDLNVSEVMSLIRWANLNDSRLSRLARNS